MKLDPDSIVVDSFNLSEPSQPIGGGDSRYCSLINTCATCWTDCPCA